jgi:hypothetical protein
MITGILIILTFIVNCLLLVYIRQEQEEYHRRVYKIQHHMWDDITQIGRTVRAIDKKIEDSTVYKTELRFMDNKKN